jgi:hypothetical protein
MKPRKISRVGFLIWRPASNGSGAPEFRVIVASEQAARRYVGWCVSSIRLDRTASS